MQSRFRLFLPFIILSVLLVSACASKPPKKVDNPGNLYVDGVNLMKTKKYDQAIEKFNQIRENFPFDPMALVATVKLGDTHMEKKEYIQASGVYEDFFNSHPEDENIPYVLTRLGECYEKLALSFDRDQAYTLKAIERYTYLHNRFPNSSYAQGVEVKLKVLRQKLIDREIYVGEFYYKSFQYNAAITRLTYVLKKYPNAQGTDRVLYYLGMSLRALGDVRQAEQYLQQLRTEYPKSPLLKSGVRERKRLQLAKAEVPPPSYSERGKREIDLRPELAQGEQPKKDEGFALFDEKKPVDIISDTMEGFDKEKYVIFKGNVVAHQEGLWIYSDVIEAFMDEKGNEIERAVAKGNVKIVKGERTATSNEAFFDNRKGEIILKGSVIVFSGPDKLTGEMVTYYINEERVVVGAEKEKRARIIINPK